MYREYGWFLASPLYTLADARKPGHPRVQTFGGLQWCSCVFLKYINPVGMFQNREPQDPMVGNIIPPRLKDKPMYQTLVHTSFL